VGLRVKAQNPEAITLRSDVQEANTTTGVITARGNVYIDYPAQRILRAEVVTYLIDESRFVAAAAPNQQVQAVYHLPTNQASDNLSVNPPPMGSSSNSSAEPPLVLDLNPVNSPAP
jgi:lipopolysaccharide export system protein LptA